MPDPLDLPQEFEHVADLLSEASPQVRDLFRYALVLAMIDDEKARVVDTRVEDGREYVTVKTITGDEFEMWGLLSRALFGPSSGETGVSALLR